MDTLIHKKGNTTFYGPPKLIEVIRNTLPKVTLSESNKPHPSLFVRCEGSLEDITCHYYTLSGLRIYSYYPINYFYQLLWEVEKDYKILY